MRWQSRKLRERRCAATQQHDADGGPGEQRQDPAVVAREDGGHEDQRDAARAAASARGEARYSRKLRHSTSQTTRQIISQRNSGSVMAVVCR